MQKSTLTRLLTTALVLMSPAAFSAGAGEPYPECYMLPLDQEESCAIAMCSARMGYPYGTVPDAATKKYCRDYFRRWYYDQKAKYKAQEEAREQRLKEKRELERRTAEFEESQRKLRQEAELRKKTELEEKQAEAAHKRQTELADMRAGKRPPKNCLEVAEMEGATLLTQVLIQPPNKSYFTLGQIERSEATGLLLRRPNRQGENAPPMFYRALTSPRTVWFDKESLGIGHVVTIVGRYTANDSVQLITGAEAAVAVFETSCVESAIRTML